MTAVDIGAKQVTATFAYPACRGRAGPGAGRLRHRHRAALARLPRTDRPPTVLKLIGDINGDGNMVYIEYTCDFTTTPGNLYRNVMPYDQTTAKVAPTSSQVLLSNILANPGGTACFTYMPSPLPVVGGDTFVLDVAITLTVQTQVIDPITRQFQTETKALLNVSPRNVFNVWQLASAGVTERVQPIPATVASLLP